MRKVCTVIEYVTEEVERQGHDTLALDGIRRVGWMLNAWSYALGMAPAKPGLKEIRDLGGLVERERNRTGFRKSGVRVGDRICPDWTEVPNLLKLLLLKRDKLDPLDFYRQFEEIHPFIDGNGRSGKILLNWLGGTLLAPVFPPNDFWVEPIRNP